jgi:carbohydrate-binding DOMON domain-containing protein
MGSIVDAGFAETGIAKYALLDPAAEISSLEQIFIITEYSTEVNTITPEKTESETPVETQAVQETFPEGNVG